jgi:hypothetical protein
MLCFSNDSTVGVLLRLAMFLEVSGKLGVNFLEECEKWV